MEGDERHEASTTLMTDTHRLFLQYFIGTHIEKENAVRTKLQEICRHFGLETALDLEEAVATINHNLHFLWLEIRRVVDELSGAVWYGIANMRADDYAKLATSYSEREIEFLKKLVPTQMLLLVEELCWMEGIMNSSRGTLDQTQLSGTVPGGMTKSEAQETIGSLLADHWLSEVKRGQLSLGVRTLLELRSYIEATFPDHINECVFCHELVVLGESCPNSKCGTRAHYHCLRRWSEGKNRSKAPLKCPSCSTDWTPGTGPSGPSRNRQPQKEDAEEEDSMEEAHESEDDETDN